MEAAATLLSEGGQTAVSTRAVAAAAAVQAPTIYRLFGDKAGLLDAVAERGYEQYLASKVLPISDADPLDQLREGWDLHLDFALSNPALYVLMTQPRPAAPSPAYQLGLTHLTSLVRQVARAGRLRCDVDDAALMIHAAGVGATLVILGQPPDSRDTSVSTHMREATISAITTDAPTRDSLPAATAAITLREAVSAETGLSDAELGLLKEWLSRVADKTSQKGGSLRPRGRRSGG